MVQLKESICIKLCFKLRRTALEMYEMLKTAFGDNVMGGTQTFEWFSGFKHGELRPKIVSVQVVPPQVAQMKTGITFTKSPTKADKVPFRRSLAG
jgi:hypothetical protein